MDTTELTAEPRTVIGKQVRQLRRQGLVPASLYGHGVQSVTLQLPERALTQRLAKASRSTLFTLSLNGERPTVLIKEVQRHPISRKILHVDFYRVKMTEKLRASVSLQFLGDAPAVKEFSGTLLTSLDAVEVEALPSDLPSSLEVDVSVLATLDDAIHVSDIASPRGVEVLTPGDELVAGVLPPTVEPKVTVPEEVVTEAPAEAAAHEPAEASGAAAEQSE